jgi:hypothetical protein
MDCPRPSAALRARPAHLYAKSTLTCCLAGRHPLPYRFAPPQTDPGNPVADCAAAGTTRTGMTENMGQMRWKEDGSGAP